MPMLERQAKMSRMYANRLPGVLVVLEDMCDPHNAAAILRSCDGLGVGQVCYLFDRVEPYDPRTLGKCSSATANQWVDIETTTNRATLEAALSMDGYTSVASVLHDPSAVALWQHEFRAPKLALWVGNERTGLSPEARAFCDYTLTIPMRGMVESFNVSVATALILAEIVRQRRPDGDGTESPR